MKFCYCCSQNVNVDTLKDPDDILQVHNAGKVLSLSCDATEFTN